MTGYLHPNYLASFASLGTPLRLPRARGWLLKRGIPGSPLFDAMGAYPIFCCQEWAELPRDLEEQGEEVVSLSLVTDPFGDFTLELLERSFPDRLIPFKEHFVLDLRRGLDGISRHHRRNARRGEAALEIDICEQPLPQLGEWVGLYEQLIRRHGIRGIAAFSREAFATQLGIPGITVFTARDAGGTLGMLLCYRQLDLCYYHLGAFSERGYRLRASFALFSAAIEYFRERGGRWLDLGGGAGLSSPADDGLARFKRGWSTETRTVYFCGRVCDRPQYEGLSRLKGAAGGAYFPAYRQSEFR